MLEEPTVGENALQDPGKRSTLEPGREKSGPAPASLQHPLLTKFNIVPPGEKCLEGLSPFSHFTGNEGSIWSREAIH